MNCAFVTAENPGRKARFKSDGGRARSRTCELTEDFLDASDRRDIGRGIVSAASGAWRWQGFERRWEWDKKRGGTLWQA